MSLKEIRIQLLINGDNTLFEFSDFWPLDSVLVRKI
jgi:hypothetical protein